MKTFEVKERQFGENMFYVRPLPAFVAANISGELFALILPAVASLAPIAGAKGGAESLLDVDSETAANALAKGMSGISGDKLERLLKMLLVQHRNISFEPIGANKSGQPQLLTEDLANDMFCGDIQDMFMLAFDVIKGNYRGFFGKLDSLFGNLIEKFKNMTEMEEAGSSLIDTENST